MVAKFINISAYKFCSLPHEKLGEYQRVLLKEANLLELKGTILLSEEGINVFFSGSRESVDRFIECLDAHDAFGGLPYKESPSDYQPFTRMLVRIKKEIISMGRNEIKPAEKTGQHLPVQEFKRWYDNNKDMIVLDTRNDYEVELGTFKNALDLNIETFRAFPDAVKELPEAMKEKPVVTFCTGGIRCEKASQYMINNGFKEVYQLDGGILKYFEECGGEHYDGECFVFDKRVSLDCNLEETTVTQCYACRMPLTENVRKDTGECVHCGGNALTGQCAA